ncbi:MAG: hypothetical protein GF398_17075 [Chitinivibrionales bacterium]|nr:hypothetical protein [Chitinivibrionales bacterium]
MYLLNKYPHPANCEFVTDPGACEDVRTIRLSIDAGKGDVYRITAANPAIWQTESIDTEIAFEPRDPSRRETGNTNLELNSAGQIQFSDGQGKLLLESVPFFTFGVSGTCWLFTFRMTADMQFFGLGEKQRPFERSGGSYKFWNVDVWADHSTKSVRENKYDPDYISIPYVIVKRNNTYIGMLLDSPCCSFVSLNDRRMKMNQLTGDKQPSFFLGAENGPPSLFIVYGPSLRKLTRTFHRLVGTGSRPPLWALGNHQCKWGYAAFSDLTYLADNFEKHRIPVDGLWLDIGYMDGYRIFTYDKKHFADPVKDIAKIRQRGYHVVPIIDPGVKRDDNYAVYQNGKARDVFCKNPQGGEFTGIVWPGLSVYPDFLLDECRRWWADQVARFAETGISGAWLDMNDPACGCVDCTSMLFRNGALSHDACHNLYAVLMAKATKAGFLKLQPGKRTFLISRSGFTGSQKYAGNWLGDNFSNYFHLRMTIGKSLNLSLSGISMIGPDIGGFGGECNAQLLIDWVKACFLFPFFRNHADLSSSNQEPWVFTKRTLHITRKFIRLRYKLLPYLYNLYIHHECTGDPILRPLFYEFTDTRALALAHIDDQFMVGPAIMQAPFVDEQAQRRKVVLPKGWWFDLVGGKWLEGGRNITVKKHDASTPLYVRDGSIIPLQKGVRRDNRNDLNDIELLVAVSPRFRKKAHYTYVVDDGESFEYRSGVGTEYDFTARNVRGEVRVDAVARKKKYGAVTYSIIDVNCSGAALF